MRSHKLKFQALWRLLFPKFTQYCEQHDPALRDKIEEFSSDADKNKIEKLSCHRRKIIAQKWLFGHEQLRHNKENVSPEIHVDITLNIYDGPEIKVCHVPVSQSEGVKENPLRNDASELHHISTTGIVPSQKSVLKIITAAEDNFNNSVISTEVETNLHGLVFNKIPKCGSSTMGHLLKLLAKNNNFSIIFYAGPKVMSDHRQDFFECYKARDVECAYVMNVSDTPMGKLAIPYFCGHDAYCL
ncbi:hypothetical protein GQR58_014317 [Nymphon striatum]|nr:hypothetical protein GQR58_014317 [Nymphon striatum]